MYGPRDMHQTRRRAVKPAVPNHELEATVLQEVRAEEDQRRLDEWLAADEELAYQLFCEALAQDYRDQDVAEALIQEYQNQKELEDAAVRVTELVEHEHGVVVSLTCMAQGPPASRDSELATSNSVTSSEAAPVSVTAATPVMVPLSDSEVHATAPAATASMAVNVAASTHSYDEPAADEECRPRIGFKKRSTRRTVRYTQGHLGTQDSVELKPEDSHSHRSTTRKLLTLAQCNELNLVREEKVAQRRALQAAQRRAQWRAQRRRLD